MAIENPWVGYIDRSYQQIKTSLLTRLSTSNPEITDHSESNILVTIISMFSGVAEMLNYYIDNMAREAFIATARKFTSMVKLVKLLDYRIKASNPATVDVVFTFNTASTGLGVIPAGTVLKTANNVQFITVENLHVPIGSTSVTVGAKQVTEVINQTLGTTTGIDYEAFPIGEQYVHNSIVLRVDGNPWDNVTTMGFSGPLNTHYIVEVDVDGLAYAVFGNDVNGMVPPFPKAVTADYEITQGSLGNVEANTITTIVSTLTIPGVANITVNNPIAASGGAEYEDIERIRVNAPLSIRTLDRAVTEQDYIDISRLAPGVGKSAIYFNCGKTVKIYIAPVGGGIAQSPLLNSTKNFVDYRKMITTFTEVLPAGETPLLIDLKVTAKFRSVVTQVQSDVEDALVSFGSYDNQNINKKVRLSDIIALIDNLEKVEYVDLNSLLTRPYARPYNHTTQLSWVRSSLTTSTVKSLWKLVYQGSNNFQVIKDTVYQGIATVGTPWVDPAGSVEFTILASAYTTGEIWEFTVYPANVNIELDDFSMPLVELADITLTIEEQLIPPVI